MFAHYFIISSILFPPPVFCFLLQSFTFHLVISSPPFLSSSTSSSFSSCLMVFMGTLLVFKFLVSKLFKSDPETVRYTNTGFCSSTGIFSLSFNLMLSQRSHHFLPLSLFCSMFSVTVHILKHWAQSFTFRFFKTLKFITKH